MRKITSAIGWIVIVVAAVAWLSSGSDDGTQTDTTDSYAATVGYPDDDELGAGGGSVEEDSFDGEPESFDEEPVPVWDPPAGFALWAGAETVAWRWVEDPACGYGRCWQVEVVTRDGCPNGLYVSMNVLDGAGVVVDYTNDSLNSLEAEQTARLTLTELSDEPSRKGRITEINCY